MNNELVELLNGLKPCPFCGGPAEIVDNSRYDPGTYFVGCLYCGARSDYEHGEENAAELWNGRVSDEGDN